MDVRELARKLRPIIPREVDAWIESREQVDGQLAGLLDREMLERAREILGNPERILLSLPPESLSGGDFNLGRVVYEKERHPFFLKREELMQNLAVFGRSGGGKTNAVFHLILQLHKEGIPWLFLDWKRTARHLLPILKKVRIFTPGRQLSPLAFNPFVVPPGLESHIYLHHLVDSMAQAYTLGEGAKSLIQRAVMGLYSSGNEAPGVDDVLEAMEQEGATGRASGWRQTAVRALESMKFSGLGVGGNQELAVEAARSLLRGSSIVELESLSSSGKKFLVPLLCLWLYHVKMASPAREKLSLVIIVEEAHNVFYQRQGGETTMDMLLRQCRELGMGMIVVDQHPSLISQSVLGNCYTSICLNLKNPGDARAGAALSGLESANYGLFTDLPVGVAVVKLQDRWRKPVMIRVPEVRVSKGSVTDKVLEQVFGKPQAVSMIGNGSRSALPLSGSIEALSGTLQASTPKDRHSPSTIALLQDILLNSEDGVDNRYKRLGFSASRGSRLRDQLILKGLVEKQVVKVGGTRRVALRLTKEGYDALGSEPANMQPSLAHEFFKALWAHRLSLEGWEVEKEGSRKSGGRVDVIAKRGKERIAIEVETGLSDIAGNVLNDLEEGFTRILIVPTDKTAEAKVTKALVENNLLDKVEVQS